MDILIPRLQDGCIVETDVSIITTGPGWKRPTHTAIHLVQIYGRQICIPKYTNPCFQRVSGWDGSSGTIPKIYGTVSNDLKQNSLQNDMISPASAFRYTSSNHSIATYWLYDSGNPIVLDDTSGLCQLNQK